MNSSITAGDNHSRQWVLNVAIGCTRQSWEKKKKRLRITKLNITNGCPIQYIWIWISSPINCKLKRAQGISSLHDFGLPQMKDRQDEIIVGIFLFFGQNRLSYILRYERFDNSRYTGLVNQDCLMSISDRVKNPITSSTYEPIKIQLEMMHWLSQSATVPKKKKNPHVNTTTDRFIFMCCLLWVHADYLHLPALLHH